MRILAGNVNRLPFSLIARPGIRDWLAFGKLGLRSRGLRNDLGETVEVLTGAARPILDRWFQSEELKATLATDAIIGAFAAPSMPGTAYVLFHHVMGETNGKKGVWSYVRGGMGGLTQALAQAAKDLGAEILTEKEVVCPVALAAGVNTRPRRSACTWAAVPVTV